MRLLVDGLANRLRSFGSPGVDQIRWLKPVRPGDTLRLVVEVAEVRPSASKPDRGTVWFDETLFNQAGEVVMTKRSLGIIGRRPSA
jgi:acyl dehydratase